MLTAVRASGFVVNAPRCLRCHACSTLAPELFAVREAAQLVRQPANDAERDRAMAALLICPAQAIGVRDEA